MVLQILQSHAVPHDAGTQLQIVGYDDTVRSDKDLDGQWHFRCRNIVFQRILHQHLYTGRDDFPLVQCLVVSDFNSQGIAETNTLQIEIGFDESQLFGYRYQRSVVCREQITVNAGEFFGEMVGLFRIFVGERGQDIEAVK